MVVLAGYKTVKEALINNADMFGERHAPLILQEVNQDNGTETKKKRTKVVVLCVTFRKTSSVKYSDFNLSSTERQGFYGPMEIRGKR